MLSSLVFQPVTSSGYSQSSTQPHVWSPAHRDAITWLLCYVTAIGCQSNSASSTSCVWWYIAACTATHHRRPTWRTWSRRRSLQLSDLASDLPHPVHLQSINQSINQTRQFLTRRNTAKPLQAYERASMRERNYQICRLLLPTDVIHYLDTSVAYRRTHLLRRHFNCQ